MYPGVYGFLQTPGGDVKITTGDGRARLQNLSYDTTVVHRDGDLAHNIRVPNQTR